MYLPVHAHDSLSISASDKLSLLYETVQLTCINDDQTKTTKQNEKPNALTQWHFYSVIFFLRK